MGSGLEILVNGYVSRILLEQVPLNYKQAFTEFLRSRADGAAGSSWSGKERPFFVSPAEAAMWWLSGAETLRQWMKERGAVLEEATGGRVLQRFEGLGSGKDGIGVFDLALMVDGLTVSMYYPFDPPADMGGRTARIDCIPIRRGIPPEATLPDRGFVAVVSGTWGRGTMRFSGTLEGVFEERRLEILAIDLSGLGVGEDHFVRGMRYGGQDLTAEIIREESPEPYPVCWYSATRKTWVGMEEEE